MTSFDLDLSGFDRNQLGTGLNWVTYPSSLHAVSTSGLDVMLANDTVFPDYGQCIAIDNETNRIFSVGGHFENGTAIDRLAIYQLDDEYNVVLERELKLDKPRAFGMCWFLKLDKPRAF